MGARIRTFSTQVNKLDWTGEHSKITTPTQMTAYILKDFKSIYSQVDEFFSKKDKQNIFREIYQDINNVYINALD